jgi:cell division protein FtsA
MFPGASNDLQALLDIGSRKIACAIVESGSGRVLSMVTLPSSGIRAGDVRDPRIAHGAIAKAVVEAERLAGAQAINALIAIGSGRIAAERIAGDAALDPPIVTAAVASRLRASLVAHAERGGRIAIHLVEGAHSLDGRRFPMSPVDRFGRHLELDLTAVTVDGAPLRRLLEVVEATQLPAAGVVPAGLAAALAVTTPALRHAGVAVIDVGAEQTSVTTFASGRLTSLSGIALGANQLIADVAGALQVTSSKAERIISDYGIHRLAHAGGPDALAHHGGSGFTHNPSPDGNHPSAIGPDARAALTDSLVLRLEMLLRLAADNFDAPAAALSQASAIVLTGGGSHLAGLADHASYVWGRKVICGAPLGFDGLDPSLARPEAAVIAGLVLASRQPSIGVRFARPTRAQQIA